MPINVISPEEWMNKTTAVQSLVTDVRSPGEFQHAHIPGAVNVPLFSDEERVRIGTLYKQTSREAAIKEGLDCFGPTMRKMVERVETLLYHPDNPQGKEVYVHCWRGGMRSMAVAWLLDLYGFQVYVLQGGYKAFRNWVLQQFAIPTPVCIVGGYTGSGKTRILQSLKQLGQCIIDLEDLAHHKGSAFGNIGMPAQPSQEMFENKLALELHQKRNSQLIWLEDESQRIGDVNIPHEFWQQLIQKKVYFLNLPFEMRLENIVREYGGLDRERLVHAVVRIRKRLGGLQAQHTIQHLIEDNVSEAFEILLRYYDTFYQKSMSRKINPEQQFITLDSGVNDSNEHAKMLITSIHKDEERFLA